jgi:hypothetical protein
MNQSSVVLPLLFKFTFKCALKNVQVCLDGLKLNGTHQLLVCADDVHILGGNVRTVKKRNTSVVAS